MAGQLTLGAEEITTADVPVGLQFFVSGKPQTAGSKTAIVGHRKDGTAFANVVDGGKRHIRDAKKAWRADLRAEAAEAIETLGWEIPAPDVGLYLAIVIVRKRPSDHLRTGRAAGVVKDWAIGLRPTARPDSVKLVRAAEDALTSVVWHDDSAVVDHHIAKVFGDQWSGDPYHEGMSVTVALSPPWSPSGLGLVDLNERMSE